MPRMIFVNLPVKELEASTAFYESLGFSKNSQFSDDNASSMVICDTIHVMLLTEPFFKGFTKKDIADSLASTEAIIALSEDSRDAVDELTDKALAAGGQTAIDPQDHGFMYSRSFYDLDGHHWEVFWMDLSAIEG
ncbi:MAG: VOC family protein [Thermomicrobiales bacterium]